jgi:hypothetical protein
VVILGSVELGLKPSLLSVVPAMPTIPAIVVTSCVQG